MPRRFATTALTHVVLLLPELIFIWKGYPLHFSIAGYLQLLLLGVGLLSIFYGSLLADDMNMDAYMKIIFAILAILFFIILYNPRHNTGAAVAGYFIWVICFLLL